MQLADEQQVAKNVYGALNSQLLDELPKLCSLSAEILQSCVQEFLRARKTFVGRATRELLTLMEVSRTVPLARPRLAHPVCPSVYIWDKGAVLPHM